MNKPLNSLVSDTSIVSIQEEESAEERDKRTFVQRAFAPLNAGAMRGSIFALLASAMGSGMFNLPYRVNQVGVVPFLLFLLATGLFSYIGMYLISRLIIRFKIKSYSEMCERAYGPAFKKFAEVCMIVHPWGVTVCFQVILGKFVLQIVQDVFKAGFYVPGGRTIETYSESGTNHPYKGNIANICVVLGAIALNLIFILKKQIALLQKISVIGVIAVAVNIAIIVITFFVGFTTKVTGSTVDFKGIIGIDWGKVNWFSVDGWNAFSQDMQAIAACIFCFVNHQLVFPLVFDLKNPTKRRLDKVFYRVHSTEIMVYASVGICGYFLLEEHLDTFPIGCMVMTSILSSIMTLGKIFMIVALFFAVPLSLFPCRDMIYQCFGLEKNNRNHIILSLGLALSGSILAIFFQNLSIYFSLLGGTAGVMKAGGFPAICFYKLKGPRTLNQKLLLLFMAIITIFAFLGAILTVVYWS